MSHTLVSVEGINRFDAIIDARSPAEFAEDHIPGAINLPVLNNDERARVGTLYKQESPFAAKKIGAALVARNVAHHLETHFLEQDKGYRPLVYCWRGGNRSGAMVTILRAVGWQALQLEGGYKAFRKQVMAELEILPDTLRFVVVCGPTGSGKSRFLHALHTSGAQVLDLEDLAAHKGSLLGALPDTPQPNQKLFESHIWHALRRFDPARPVFVESESKKIGCLHTPGRLIERMRRSECLRLEADPAVRIALLKDEYPHFLAQPESLNRQLTLLIDLRGRERVEHWQSLALAGDWDALVSLLLAEHYDPAYHRSLGNNYPQAAQGPLLRLNDTAPETLSALATAAIGLFS